MCCESDRRICFWLGSPYQSSKRKYRKLASNITYRQQPMPRIFLYVLQPSFLPGVSNFGPPTVSSSSLPVHRPTTYPLIPCLGVFLCQFSLLSSASGSSLKTLAATLFPCFFSAKEDTEEDEKHRNGYLKIKLLLLLLFYFTEVRLPIQTLLTVTKPLDSQDRNSTVQKRQIGISNLFGHIVQKTQRF